MDPDELRRARLFLSEDLDLLDGGRSVAGMRGDGEAGLARRDGGGARDLAVELVQWTSIHTNLDEARLYAVDAAASLVDPTLSELLSGLGERECWQIFVIAA